MAIEYTIYLVNKQLTNQTFWCFLVPPEISETSVIFGNSSANLTVAPNAQGTNSFGIPSQYNVGAGACNQAVAVNMQIHSSVVIEETDLTDVWNATYVTVPPKMGPTLTRDSNAIANSGTIQMITNTFDATKNESENWYANQTFGIETDAGMVGVTWAPTPGSTATITPKFSFYVCTGTYTENYLVDLTTVSKTSALISFSSFSLQREATVTRNSNGTWSVTPGKPPKIELFADEYISSLVNTHHLLAQAQVELTHAHYDLLNQIFMGCNEHIQNLCS